jgi:DNA polymerase-3 subunit epsilon
MNNIDFVAIDLETATWLRSSICEIGIAIVESSRIVDSKSWLVRPEGNIYDPVNIGIHGITPEMTKTSPTFGNVWKEVDPYLEGNVVVAHNSAFDMYALRDAFDKAGMCYPHFTDYCSYRIAKYSFKDAYSYSLPNLCHSLGIGFTHHHRACGDAIGCAEVFLKCLEFSDVENIEDLQSKYGFECGEFGDGLFRPQRSVRK